MVDPPPQPPQPPDPLDCCGEGCARCVHDIHEEAMERYKRELAAWKLRHPGTDPMSGKEGDPR